MAQPAENVTPIQKQSAKPSREAMLENAANELVFAVVGHVGSGTTEVARQLGSLLRDPSAIGHPYEVNYIKATDLIAAWAQVSGRSVPSLSPGESKTLHYVTAFQDLGDDMRAQHNDPSAVAKAFVIEIRRCRADKLNISASPGVPIPPDGTRRAYVLDSIRHPFEVHLLRHIYQDAFVLVGVVCESETRVTRIRSKYPDASSVDVARFMRRDEKAPEPHGQRVSDAFHLSDFFLDNTPNRTNPDSSPNRSWDISEKLSRLGKIIRQGDDIVRPEAGETAMWQAQGAAMRSACLSRQVGAAVLDANGNVIATGTNEVPRAGGGVYGERFTPDASDHRCAYRASGGDKAFCSNTREQNEIITEVLQAIPQLNGLSDDERNKLVAALKKGRVGELLEFSRAVHAEMDAILSATRTGASTVGGRLFVTTFPCHYCARHIVSAGIDEVQYIEPYPKSKTLKLHSDSVQLVADNWVLPSSVRSSAMTPPDSGRKPSQTTPKVLFRPFSGVAPRLYHRAFFKDTELKNGVTGEQQVHRPDWGTPWHLRALSYAELEAALTKES